MEILKRIFNIAVDCGKFNGKFAYRKGEELKAGLIRASMREGHAGFGKNDGVHQIVVDGQKYTIGDATDSYSDDNIALQKSSELHKLVTLTAICKALKDAGAKAEGETNVETEVNLSINIPITQYNSSSERTAIENLYKGEQEVIFDGEVFKFNIATVLVQFETAGIITKYRKAFADENVIICDCGGLNITRIALRKGRIVPDSAKLNAYGSNKLVDEVTEKLYQQHGLEFEKEDVLEMIRGVQVVTGDNAEKIKTVIAEEVDEFTSKIVSDLKKDANLDIYSVFLCGGSSTIYQQGIAKKVQCSVKASEDSVFDNVKGVLIYLEAYLTAKSA